MSEKQYGDPVSNGGGFPLSEIGDVLCGIYVRKELSYFDNGDEKIEYIFRDEYGENVAVRGGKFLNGAMKNFGYGADLRIERIEDIPTQYKPMRAYKIQCVLGTENKGNYKEAPPEPRPVKLGFEVGDKLLPAQVEDCKQFIKDNNLAWSIDSNLVIMPF